MKLFLYIINGIGLAALAFVILMKVVEEADITTRLPSISEIDGWYNAPLTIQQDTTTHHVASSGIEDYIWGVYNKSTQQFVSELRFTELKNEYWLKDRFMIMGGIPVDAQDKIVFLVYDKEGNLLLTKQYDVPQVGVRRFFIQYVNPLLIKTFVWNEDKQTSFETELMDLNGKAPSDKAQFILDNSNLIWWLTKIISVVIGLILAYPLTKLESQRIKKI